MTSKSTFVEKEGYLWVKRIRQLKVWKWKYVVLKQCVGYDQSLCFEWYENQDAFLTHSSPKTNRFNFVTYVGNLADKRKEFAFMFYTNTFHQLELAAKTDAERAEWCLALKKFIRTGRRSQSVQPETTAQLPAYMTNFPKPVENVEEKFLVTFHDSTRPGLLQAREDYLLHVGRRQVTLTDTKEPCPEVLSWRLEIIKSYDSQPFDGNPAFKLLTIETGRKSATGHGDFHFLTPYGDDIKRLLRSNSNALRDRFFEKKHSIDSIASDFMYSSSPETTTKFGTPPRTPGESGLSRGTSVKRAIPFHEYDESPAEEQESFATYIPHENGYIHVLTAQEDVDKFHRKVSRGSVCAEPPSTSTAMGDDTSYIKVLGNNEEVYLEVLGDEQKIEVNNESDNTYIEVLGEDEEVPQSQLEEGSAPPRPLRYKKETVTAIFFSQTSNTSSLEYSSVSSENEVFSRDREASISDVFSDDLANPTFSEQFPTIPEDNHIVDEGCVENSESVATENHSRDSLELHAPSEHSAVEHEHESNGQESVEHVNDEHVNMQDENEEHENRHVDSEHVYSEHDNSEHIRSEHASEEHASEEHVSEEHASEEHVGEEHASEEHLDKEQENEGQLREKHARSPEDKAKTNSWHSVGGSDTAETSSASDGGHTRDSTELTDEEAPRPEGSSRRNSLPRQSPKSDAPFERQRSFTTNDLPDLDDESYTADDLQDLLERVATTQDFLQRNPDPITLAREAKPRTPEDRLGLDIDFQNTIVDQLTNPTAVQPSESYPRRLSKHAAGDIKYLCSECGWYKRSRKKQSVWKKEKKCERCSKVIQKTSASVDPKEQKSPKKEKAKFISRLTRKEKPSVDNNIDRDELKPGKPVPQQSFLKNLQHAQFTVHNRTLDSKRSEIGIAPSYSHALLAVSIGGESRASPRNAPISSELSVKVPLTSSKSDSSISAHQISPHSVNKQTLVKSLTCEFGKMGLTRTFSSPVSPELEKPPEVRGRAATERLTTEPRNADELPTRKLSAGGNLPALPEGGSIEEADPPALPPRTREERPPLPPRRIPNVPPRKGPSSLRRAKTDPCSTFIQNPSGSPVLPNGARKTRAMTDPCPGVLPDRGSNSGLEHVQESSEEALLTRIRSHSNEDDGNTCGDSLPPPLPPRKMSVPLSTAQHRKVSDENGKPHHTLESELSEDSIRPKAPLVATRSSEARRNFKERNPLYSKTIEEDG